jgi:hypothetical protein
LNWRRWCSGSCAHGRPTHRASRAVQLLSALPGLARERATKIDNRDKEGTPLPAGRILVLMKPAHAASRRFLPGSPFNVLPVDPPVEQFAVRDRVSHDKYGLGWVILVEEDDAVIVVFESRKVRILSPFTRLTKL